MRMLDENIYFYSKYFQVGIYGMFKELTNPIKW